MMLLLILPLLALSLLAFQICFVICSTYLSNLWCFTRREGSDMTLLKWQLASTIMGLISAAIALTMFWKFDSYSLCYGLISSEHMMYSISLSLMYAFVEQRLKVVRVSSKRTPLEIVLVGLVCLYPIFGVAAVFTTRADTCSPDTPAAIFGVQAAVDLFLNSMYLKYFMNSMSKAGNWQGHDNREQGTVHYNKVVIRNAKSSVVSTIAVVASSISYAVLMTATGIAPGLKTEVFYSIRTSTIAIWTMCMFFCTVNAWRNKHKKLTNNPSNASRNTASRHKKVSGGQDLSQSNKHAGDVPMVKVPGELALTPADSSA